MLTAEDSLSSVCQLQETAHEGRLLHGIPCLYSEDQIINATREPIVVIDVFNVRKIVQPSHVNLMHFRGVEVVFREINGARSFNVVNQSETTKTKSKSLLLHYDLLLKGPIYCRMRNVVIGLVSNTNNVLHPYSAQANEAYICDLQRSLDAGAAQQPVIISANDPSNRVKFLYTSIEGKICLVRVTNYVGHNETDTLAVLWRTNVVGNTARLVENGRARFQDLITSGTLVWELGGLVMSPSLSLLEAHLEKEKQKKDEVSFDQLIPIEEHTNILKEREELHAKKIKMLTEEVKHKDEEIKHLNTVIRRSTEMAPHQTFELKMRAQENESVRVDIERQALIEAAAKRDAQKEKDRHEWRMRIVDEVFKLATTVAKALTVIIPIAYSLYKIFAKKEATQNG